MTPATALTTLSRKDARAELDRIRIEELEEEVRRLRAELVPEIYLPRSWKLTRGQKIILASLYSAPDGFRKLSSLSVAMENCGRSGSGDNVKVHICLLRPVLKLYGVEIKSERARGYYLPLASREIIGRFIAVERAAA